MPENGPLDGRAVHVLGHGPTADFARRLVVALGADITDQPTGITADLRGAPDPIIDWATSGAMALTGRRDGPPAVAPGLPAAAVRAALSVFAALAHAATGHIPAALPGVGLLGERAAIAGLSRQGPLSCGGTFRLIPSTDGWLGVSLAREEDVAAVPALVEKTDAATRFSDPWLAVAEWASRHPSGHCVERAQLLGIPASCVATDAAPDEQLTHRRRLSGSAATAVLTAKGGRRRTTGGRPVVIDLSALWAGPLCAHLLGLAGADIIKVESTRRPDGARHGPAAFFDLLHHGHASVTLDLTDAQGIATLRRLITRADLVIEASRPRALRQMGIEAEEMVAAGTTWASLTAYGRSGPWANRVGFGDDVASAAGLVVADGHELLPCGDALADPLAGVIAAVAVQAALLNDHAHLLDISMRDAAATAQGAVAPHQVTRDADGAWWVETGTGYVPVRPPVARRAVRPAAAFGRDTTRTLARLGLA